MKSYIPCVVLSICAFVVIGGCGKQPGEPRKAAGDPLTASDLALLMDFHAWTLRIPKTQQPVKSIRIVIAKHDGAFLAPLFDTGNNLDPGTNFGSEPYSSILLGFRIEQETFTGHFFVRRSNGAGKGWNLLFTNAFADAAPAWNRAGPLEWNGNRAELGMSTRSNNFDRIMAIELDQ